MEILELFGIDWKLMLAQLINFLIVVFVLWRFAIKPLIKTMDKRNAEIKKGLDDAEEARQRLIQVEQEVEEKFKQARLEAQKIIDSANQHASQIKKEEMEKTRAEVEQMMKRAEERIKAEHKAMLDGAKEELAELVSSALEKILTEKFSKGVDRQYIDEVIKKVK